MPRCLTCPRRTYGTRCRYCLGREDGVKVGTRTYQQRTSRQLALRALALGYAQLQAWRAMRRVA